MDSRHVTVRDGRRLWKKDGMRRNRTGRETKRNMDAGRREGYKWEKCERRGGRETGRAMGRKKAKLRAKRDGQGKDRERKGKTDETEGGGETLRREMEGWMRTTEGTIGRRVETGAGLTLLFGYRSYDAVSPVSAAMFEPLLDIKSCKTTNILALHLDDEFAGNEATCENPELVGRSGADPAQLPQVGAALDRHPRLGAGRRHHGLSLLATPVLSRVTTGIVTAAVGAGTAAVVRHHHPATAATLRLASAPGTVVTWRTCFRATRRSAPLLVAMRHQTPRFPAMGHVWVAPAPQPRHHNPAHSAPRAPLYSSL